VRLDPCPSCGLANAGGEAGCQSRFDALLVRDYGDPPLYRIHRLAVDAYACQHPDRYCASARSFTAHLTGLHAFFELGGKRSALRVLQQWLSGPRALEKPALPAQRGVLTIGDVPLEVDRAELDQGIERWARSVWDAYAELHALAAQWTAEAFAQDPAAK
jgi:hypothetical protein